MVCIIKRAVLCRNNPNPKTSLGSLHETLTYLAMHRNLAFISDIPVQREWPGLPERDRFSSSTPDPFIFSISGSVILLFLNTQLFLLRRPSAVAEIYKKAARILHPVRSHRKIHIAHTWQSRFKQSVSLMFQTAMATSSGINILSGRPTVTADHWRSEKKDGGRRRKKKSHTRSNLLVCVSALLHLIKQVSCARQPATVEYTRRPNVMRNTCDWPQLPEQHIRQRKHLVKATCEDSCAVNNPVGCVGSSTRGEITAVFGGKRQFEGGWFGVCISMQECTCKNVKLHFLFLLSRRCLKS